MQTLLALYLWGLSLALLVMMLWQAVRGTEGLLTLRNLFLLGFIIFQSSSAAFALYNDNYGRLYVSNPVSAGFQFAAMSTVFVLVFLFAYKKGWGVCRLAAKAPRSEIQPGAFTLLAIAISLTLVAIPLRVGLTADLAAKLGGIFSLGFPAVACGLVGWVWGPRWKNPVIASIAIAIILASAAVVSIGAFGRRGLVGVFAAVLWGMYYSHWRHLPPRSQFLRLAVASVLPIMVVGVFTAARTGSERTRTVKDQFVAMRAEIGQVGTGLNDLVYGQNTGAYALWLFENFPNGQWETRHLLTIEMTFLNNVPRVWWANKPIMLSSQFPEMSRMWGTTWGAFTCTVGIIGTAVAEGGWYAAIVYAIFLALMLRFFDEAVRINPNNAFVVVAIGAALGQVLGLARGETAAFANLFLVVSLSGWFGLILYSKLIASLFGQTSQPLPATMHHA